MMTNRVIFLLFNSHLTKSTFGNKDVQSYTQNNFAQQSNVADTIAAWQSGTDKTASPVYMQNLLIDITSFSFHFKEDAD